MNFKKNRIRGWMMGNMKPVIITLMSAFALVSCHHEKHEAHEETRFLVTSPLKKDTSYIKEYVCQIRSIQHIELRALEKGYLQKIYVDEGQFVRKGQKMFQIMPMLYEAEMKKAEAEVSFAEIEYRNTQKLADSDIVSPNELALVKAKYDKTLAELSLAKVHLGFTEIKAPFDGIMDRFHVRLGRLLDEGDLLTSLSDNSKMWVYFNVPEAEYLDYKTNVKRDSLMRVNLLMANDKPFNYSGMVQTIEADFNNETGNIAFRATFPNPEGLLRHGETGNIQVRVPLNESIIIPQKATFQVLDKIYVYVVDQHSVVHAKQIAIEAEMPHIFVVKSGISENDKILLEGLRKVRDDDEISYDYLRPDSVVSHLELYAE